MEFKCVKSHILDPKLRSSPTEFYFNGEICYNKGKEEGEEGPHRRPLTFVYLSEEVGREVSIQVFSRTRNFRFRK